MSRPECPFPGPKPFEQQEQERFFGRDREAREIVSLIVAHQAVLVYAQSGAGKTSLLNAQVIPILRGRNADVIGTTRVSGELPPGVASDHVRNIFTFHALHGLDSDQRCGDTPPVNPGARTTDTLTGYLESRPQPGHSRDGDILPPRVLVIDQFEEVFTTSAERWKDRADFFDDLGDALEADGNLRVVLVMREEFVGALEPFTPAFPRRLRTRYRLERLRKRAAVAAVAEPLKGTGYTFGAEVAEELVENLMRVTVDDPASGTPDSGGETPAPRTMRAEFVEPVQLQVVCVQIWESLPDPPATIDAERIKVFGDVDRALAGYYERSIRGAVETPEAVRTGLTEGDLRHWFERKLITPEGTRGTVFRGAQETGGLPSRLVELLDTRFRLVRPELRGAGTWYELTHDRFIAPIRESNRQYFLAQSDVGQLLRTRTDRWLQNRKKPAYLLKPGEMEVVLGWKTRQGPLADLGSDVEDFVTESRTRVQSRRRVMRTAVPIGVVAALAVVMAGWTLAGKQRAEEAMYSERGSIARQLAAQPGQEFEALLLGIRAVGPSIERNDEPTDSAVLGLKDALAVIGNAVYLRDTSSSARIRFVSFSPDGRHVLTGAESGFTLWDSAGRLMFSVPAAQTEVPAGFSGMTRLGWEKVGFLDDRRVMAWEGPPRLFDRLWPERTKLSSVRVFDASDGTRDTAVEARLDDILEVEFRSDGEPLWTRKENGSFHFHPARRLSRNVPVSLGSAQRVTVSPGQSRLVVETDDGFDLRDAGDGRVLYSTHNGTRQAMEFSPDDSVLATRVRRTFDTVEIELRRARDGSFLSRLPTNDALGTFSRDGRVATYLGPRGTVTIWDRSTGVRGQAYAIPAGHEVVWADNEMIILLNAVPGTKTAGVSIWNPFSGGPPVERPDITLHDSRVEFYTGDGVARDGTSRFFYFEESRVEVFVSPDGNQAVVVEPDLGRVRLVRLGNAVTDVHSRSVAGLYRMACDRLRGQPEWARIAKDGLCGTEP
jgi:WD40 repeat protein